MTTAADAPCNPEHVKSVVAAQVERVLEWLFAVSESSPSAHVDWRRTCGARCCSSARHC